VHARPFMINFLCHAGLIEKRKKKLKSIKP
jgi:hypothetical protein